MLYSFLEKAHCIYIVGWVPSPFTTLSVQLRRIVRGETDYAFSITLRILTLSITINSMLIGWLPKAYQNRQSYALFTYSERSFLTLLRLLRYIFLQLIHRTYFWFFEEIFIWYPVIFLIAQNLQIYLQYAQLYDILSVTLWQMMEMQVKVCRMVYCLHHRNSVLCF